MLGNIETGHEAAVVIEWLNSCGLHYKAIACVLGVSQRTLADIRLHEATPRSQTRERLWRLYVLMEEAEEQRERRRGQRRRIRTTAENGRATRWLCSGAHR